MYLDDFFFEVNLCIKGTKAEYKCFINVKGEIILWNTVLIRRY